MNTAPSGRFQPGVSRSSLLDEIECVFNTYRSDQIASTSFGTTNNSTSRNALSFGRSAGASVIASAQQTQGVGARNFSNSAATGGANANSGNLRRARGRSTSVINANRESDGESDERSWQYPTWRIWLGAKTALMAAIEGFGIWALVHDSRPCDTRIVDYMIAQMAFCGTQTLVCLVMFIVLPYQTRRWTWENHSRMRIMVFFWGASLVILLGQLILVPMGIAFIRNCSFACTIAPTNTYTVTYYIVLIQAIVFVLFSIPGLCLPCLIIIVDIPTYHGVSSRVVRRMPTITFHPTSGNDLPNAEIGNSKPDESPRRSLSPDSNEPAVTLELDGSPSPNRTLWTLIRGVFRRSRTSEGQESPPQQHCSILDCECCVICMESWDDGVRLKKLPCGHVFHKECILTWFDSHSQCPCCRAQVGNR
ncbi:hypothetical protein BJ742DRAFT_815169 [Cladochytrium replicatum]|nr:hypothetical protein BJ742DRAFT_815169 [Cladochytrium replicatum]